MSNQPKPVKREGTGNFVDSMLRSAENRTETKPQTRFDLVDHQQLDRVMESLQKGAIGVPSKKKR